MNILEMNILEWIKNCFIKAEKTKLKYDPNDLVVYGDDVDMENTLKEIARKKKVKFLLDT